MRALCSEVDTHGILHDPATTTVMVVNAPAASAGLPPARRGTTTAQGKGAAPLPHGHERVSSPSSSTTNVTVLLLRAAEPSS